MSVPRLASVPVRVGALPFLGATLALTLLACGEAAPPPAASPPAAPRRPASQPLGAACGGDADCASLLCSTTGQVCSRICARDADCGGAPDLVCRRKDDGSGSWCSRRVGAPPGGACLEPPDCQSNECLKLAGKEDQPGLCTTYCDDPAECPATMKTCQAISDSGLGKVCLPGAAAPAPAPAAPRAEKIGVAVCDDYLERFTACIAAMPRGSGKTSAEIALESMRKVWKDAARSASGGDMLKFGCQKALDALARNPACTR